MLRRLLMIPRNSLNSNKSTASGSCVPSALSPSVPTDAFQTTPLVVTYMIYSDVTTWVAVTSPSACEMAFGLRPVSNTSVFTVTDTLLLVSRPHATPVSSQRLRQRFRVLHSNQTPLPAETPSASNSGLFSLVSPTPASSATRTTCPSTVVLASKNN